MNTYLEIAKHQREEITTDDEEEEQMRKLNSRNFNERIIHHIFQAAVLAGHLGQRYSVPLTEGMSQEEALSFAQILQKAYNNELEAIPFNPYLKSEMKDKVIVEPKKMDEYFPFTLTNAIAKIKQPELPPGTAPPVVICQKTLVTTILTESNHKEIEKTLEGK
jgi:hypothetical protein